VLVTPAGAAFDAKVPELDLEHKCRNSANGLSETTLYRMQLGAETLLNYELRIRRDLGIVIIPLLYRA
jgi:hypothetical protein